MMRPMSEDGGPLREWSPLTNLLQQIPIKLQNGLFTQNINFTCIDALPEFIAIGTNCGLVYWYNRETGDLQRLRCEDINSSITSVQVISTVEYMIAAGNNNGTVTIFQIPKNLPESLPDSLKSKKKKQIERYNIGGIHKNSVTSVEWSKNGMKLFSGDNDGLVVLTEIDFYMHLSKSSELLNEKYTIVQLSYQHGLLLVSTNYRTILVDINDNNKVSQIGQKERKILGKYGAIFATRTTKLQEPIIYASRPGLRLWQSDKNGTVEKTLIFKDALKANNTQVKLLNPISELRKKKSQQQQQNNEITFGILKKFCDDLFVTFSDDIIYVINPITISITSVIGDLRCVIDVSCTRDEIFILEGDRNILRIGYYPEVCNIETINNNDDATDNNDYPLFADISKPVTSSLFGLTTKLKENSIVTNIPFHKIKPSNIIQALSTVSSTDGLDPQTISIDTEIAIEAVPPILPLDIDTPLVTDINVETADIACCDTNHSINDRRKIFQIIGQQEFEDVVFNPDKKINKKIFKNRDMFVGLSRDIQETKSSLLTLSIDDDGVFKKKEERNLERIQKDVENKERLLADVLNFDLSEYMTSSQSIQDECDDDNLFNSISCVGCPTLMVESGVVDFGNVGEEEEEEKDESVEEDESYRAELKKLTELAMIKAEMDNTIKDKDDNQINEKKNTVSKELEHRFNG